NEGTDGISPGKGWHDELPLGALPASRCRTETYCTAPDRPASSNFGAFSWFPRASLVTGAAPAVLDGRAKATKGDHHAHQKLLVLRRPCGADPVLSHGGTRRRRHGMERQGRGDRAREATATADRGTQHGHPSRRHVRSRQCRRAPVCLVPPAA